MKLLLDEMFSPAIAPALRSHRHDAVAIKEHPEWHAAALEASLAEYTGDDDLANGETWI